MMKKTRSIACAAAFGTGALLPGVAMAGWTVLPLDTLTSLTVTQARVCKVAIISAYGPLWYVNFQVFRRDARTTAIQARVVRYPSRTRFNAEYNTQWLYGVVAGTGRNVYASPYYDDRFVLDVFFQNGLWDPASGYYSFATNLGFLRPGEIADC